MLNIIWIFYIFFMMKRGGDSRYLFLILIMIITLYGIIKNKNWNKIFEKNKILYGSAIGYILFLTLNFIGSEELGDKLHTFLNISIYGVLFFIVIINKKLNEKIYRYIVPFMALLSLPNIYRGLKEFPNFFKYGSYRIGGGNYTTVYAVEIGLYIIVAIIGFLYNKDRKVKFLYGIYFLINFSLMIGTRSRALMIMLPITFLIMLYLNKIKYGIIGTIIIGSLGLTGIKYADKIPVMKRLSTLESVNVVEKDTRIFIYKKAYEIEKKNFPHGLGFYKYKNERLNTGVEMVMHFHNNLIETLITQGLVTFIFYIIFNISIFLNILKEYKKNRENTILLSVSLGYFIFINLVGIVEVTFYMTRATEILFTLLGLSLSLQKEKD